MRGVIDHDLVWSGHKTQALEYAVVIVHDSRGKAVNVDERLARRDLQPQRHGMIGDGSGISDNRVRIRVPLRKAGIIRSDVPALMVLGMSRHRRQRADGERAADRDT